MKEPVQRYTKGGLEMRRARVAAWLAPLLLTFAAAAQKPAPGGLTVNTAPIKLTGPGAFKPLTLATDPIKLMGPGAFKPLTLATEPIRLTGPGAFKPLTLATEPIRLTGPASKP
jgi:hypothetical protein